jgi:hypothetical protein
MALAMPALSTAEAVHEITFRREHRVGTPLAHLRDILWSKQMSKKQDFLRSEQSRDAHPNREQVGSPTRQAATAHTGAAAEDLQEPQTGKVSNDHNKLGNKALTQTNQPRRTPESRHDRQTMGAGPQNQISARKGGGGAGRGPRGAG